MSRKAFDFSNWTGVPTDQECRDLLALGYDTAIVGASYNPQLARDQITVLVAHGFRIEVYAWLRHPWRADLLDAAINASYGFPVERMWLDVEDADDAAGKTPAQLAYDVEQALAYLHSHLSVPVEIYTGSWFWDPYMESSDTFGCALWLANYRDDTSVLPPLPGGWTVLTIWQHANHLTGSAFNADDNLIYEENDMTPDETNAAIQAYVDPKVGALYQNALANGADIMAHSAQIAAIYNAFADHVRAGGAVDPALAAEVDRLKADHEALVARVTAAAAALHG